MTIVECFAAMGVIALVGVGAIAVIIIGDYVSRWIRVRKYKHKRKKGCSFCKSCESIDWSTNQADCSRFDIKVIPSVMSCKRWEARDDK